LSLSRIVKVNQQIKREISLIIQQELSDPRLMFVSILSVDTSRDIRHAKVFFSVLGEQTKVEDAENCLVKASGMIRKHLGSRLSMRNVPELLFKYDNSLGHSASIDEKLMEIHDENEKDHSDDQ